MRTGGAHDLVVLSGVEPHLRVADRTSTASSRSSTRLGCEAVVTVGADRRRRAAHPHCRRSSAAPPTPSWPRRLALSAPTYQGITGLVGVLHAELERAGVPTISLRVGVPHYLAHTEHPLAVDAP